MTSIPIDGQRRAACAALLGTLLGATGCGGGGGDAAGGAADTAGGTPPAGSGTGGNAPPPPPPPAPLTLVASAPGDRSKDVPRDVQPLLTFSATLDPLTLSGTGVTLSEVSGPVVHAVPTASGARLRLAPARPLWPDAAHRIDVQGVFVSGGEVLAAPIAVHFATRDGQWQDAPVAAARAVTAADAESHRLAMAADGSAVVAWIVPDGSRRVFGRQFERGTGALRSSAGWGDLRVLSDGNADGAPAVAVDARGNALVLWCAGSRDVRATRFTRRQGWQPATAVATTGAAVSILEPRVACDGTGSAVATWIELESHSRSPAPGDRVGIGGARFD